MIFLAFISLDSGWEPVISSYLMIDDLSGPGIRACYEAQLGRFGFDLAAHIPPDARKFLIH